MTYATPRGIMRRRHLRGLAKHRDDRDAYEYAKAPKKKELGFLGRIRRYLSRVRVVG